MPTGDDSVVRDFLRKTVDKLDGFFQRLDALEDTHSQLLLLRHCLGACRVGYLMRTLRFEYAQDLAVRSAAMVVRSLRAVIQWSPSQLFLASCPTREGGLGLRDPMLELSGTAIGSLLEYLQQELDAPVASHANLFSARPPAEDYFVLTFGQWRLFLQYSLAILLGSSDVAPCHVCGAPADTFGDHALMCPRLGVFPTQPPAQYLGRASEVLCLFCTPGGGSHFQP